MDERDAIAARVVHNAATSGGGPWTLEVYPTLRCNLSCQFCDTTDRHRKPQNELSGARWSQIIDEAADLGTQRIMVLGGGEPLLAEAAQAIFSRAKLRGLTGFLTTNGTRLARFAPLLAQIGWDEVHVSIDGANANTHDRPERRVSSERARAVRAARIIRRATARNSHRHNPREPRRAARHRTAWRGAGLRARRV